MWQVIVIDYICDVIAPCLQQTSSADVVYNSLWNTFYILNLLALSFSWICMNNVQTSLVSMKTKPTTVKIMIAIRQRCRHMSNFSVNLKTRVL